MQVSNQKPVELSPVYAPRITGDYNPADYIKKIMVEPLYQPMVPTSPVSIKDNGVDIAPDTITNAIMSCCGDKVDTNAEDSMKEVFSKTLLNFDKNTPLGIQNTFVIQSAKKCGLPYPSATILYTPGADIIPSCKDFIAGTCDYDKLFTSFAFFTHADTLGIYFINDTAFDDFKTYLATNTASLLQVLPATTQSALRDFQKLKLDGLTESILLRNTPTDGNDPHSFPRFLVAMLMTYTKQVSSTLFGIMPFTISELFTPKSVVFINIDKHARATAKQINDEWKLINQSLTTMRPKVLSNSRIQKLTTAARTASNAIAYAAATSTGKLAKSATFRFRKTAPTNVDITKMVMRVLKHMECVNRSTNVYKQSKHSFAKQNRRDPDNYDKMGTIVSTKYKPDIHVYIDTSGSISERNYQDAIKSCIKMAKKLNVDMYFNSFSSVISESTKLHTKGKTSNQIYKEFQHVPKVTGGTNFEQVWHYINKSAKRKREFSLMITDFEYPVPNHYVPHPTNLYYAPCSNFSWNRITRCAEEFGKGMLRNEPNIRKHILC